MKNVLLICATRKTRKEFARSAPLSASLKQLRASSIKVTSRISYQNQEGLGAIYNQYLNPRNKARILVFVHDDVSIEDLCFVEKLNSAIDVFDVIGLAGNQQPNINCLSWFDRSQPLAGFVAHPSPEPSTSAKLEQVIVSSYGPTPAPCGLLDGCFLAVNTENVLASGVRFDEQFAFHFYDLDFCLSCSSKGLRLGTWPLWVIHQSGGSFNSPEWTQAAELYQRKWKLKRPEEIKLDLACGNNKQEGFIGVDLRREGSQADIEHDLETYPWPFQDQSVDEAFCSHYLEHLSDVFAFMNELWRVMKPGGSVKFVTPYYTSVRAFQDPTHKLFVSEQTFLYFDQEWRQTNRLWHYPLRCDFKIERIERLVNEAFRGKSPEAIAEAAMRYWNVIDEMSVVLRKPE